MQQFSRSTQMHLRTCSEKRLRNASCSLSDCYPCISSQTSLTIPHTRQATVRQSTASYPQAVARDLDCRPDAPPMDYRGRIVICILEARGFYQRGASLKLPHFQHCHRDVLIGFGVRFPSRTIFERICVVSSPDVRSCSLPALLGIWLSRLPKQLQHTYGICFLKFTTLYAIAGLGPRSVHQSPSRSSGPEQVQKLIGGPASRGLKFSPRRRARENRRTSNSGYIKCIRLAKVRHSPPKKRTIPLVLNLRILLVLVPQHAKAHKIQHCDLYHGWYRWLQLWHGRGQSANKPGSARLLQILQS